jgi:hypothetical protein
MNARIQGFEKTQRVYTNVDTNGLYYMYHNPNTDKTIFIDEHGNQVATFYATNGDGVIVKLNTGERIKLLGLQFITQTCERFVTHMKYTCIPNMQFIKV